MKRKDLIYNEHIPYLQMILLKTLSLKYINISLVGNHFAW